MKYAFIEGGKLNNINQEVCQNEDCTNQSASAFSTKVENRRDYSIDRLRA